MPLEGMHLIGWLNCHTVEDVVELSLIQGRCLFSWISFLCWGIPLGFWCLPLSAWEWNFSAVVTLDPRYPSFLIQKIYSSLLLIKCYFFNTKKITITVKKSWPINNLFQTFDMSPWKTSTEKSGSTKWEKGDYTVPNMSDIWAILGRGYTDEAAGYVSWQGADNDRHSMTAHGDVLWYACSSYSIMSLISPRQKGFHALLCYTFEHLCC